MFSHRNLASTGASLDLEPLEPRAPTNPWQIISAIIAALAAVFTSIAQWKGSHLVAMTLASTALLVATSVFYRPGAARIKALRQNRRRKRIARKSWQEFLRVEKRFGTFLNENDTGNLRNIILEIHGRNPDETSKVCGPDYLNDYFGLIYSRHLKMPTKASDGAFHFALTELHLMVCSYNRDYVLDPLRRLNGSPNFGQLQQSAREHYKEKTKQFRERWVRFLDDFKEFLDKTNHELRYDYREGIGTYFEYPKTL